MRSAVLKAATCLFAVAALGAFVHLCCTGAARDALAALGCFTPCIAWLAFDFGRASR